MRRCRVYRVFPAHTPYLQNADARLRNFGHRGDGEARAVVAVSGMRFYAGEHRENAAGNGGCVLIWSQNESPR